MLYYLHGFASSSQSEKARLTVDYFSTLPGIQISALDLPYTPDTAMAVLAQQITTPPTAIIGSSLGGFLATVLAERYGCRACLINPAVAPHKVLADYVGDYHHPVLQQSYQVRAEHMTQLASLMPLTLKRPEQYFVLLQSGDEVLDYRQALEYYQGAEIKLSEGGDHSYVGYAAELETIANFCQLA